MTLITIEELSDLLKVKKSTLYSWVHYGTIPFYKLNGLLRFEMDEIMEWVKGSKPEPCSPIGKLKKAQTEDIDTLVKRAIEGVKGKGYNPSKRETSLSQGLRKEV